MNVFLSAKEEAFKIKIRVRSQAHEELIKREWGALTTGVA